MISCTEFIWVYNELFKFLHKRGGKKEVVRFWEHLSDQYLTNLRNSVAANGLKGCWLYWERILNEEAADFTMELDEQAGEFCIRMHHCPSMGRLLSTRHIEPYAHYCEHCDLLYRRVLEPLGYEFQIDLSRGSQATCALTVRRKPPPP